MTIASFDDLLHAARAQPEPQRLLFVFAGAELPDDATGEQRVRFEAGEGGTLTPVMSADKALEDLTTFSALVAESRQFGRDWAIVFVGCLAGRDGLAPSGEDAGPVLEKMVQSVKVGQLGAYLPFDRSGEPVALG